MAKKARTKSTSPGAVSTAKKPKVGHNGPVEQSAEDVRARFLIHRTAWNGVQAKIAAVKALETDVKAALKVDGYTVKQMQIADQLATVKGEAKVTGEVADRLQVARWIGHPMGAQLDLFNEPDRTPSVEVAYEAGKQIGLEGGRRMPPHSPEVPQYEAWMNGYYAGQEILARTGFKEPDGPAHEEVTAP